ncbi:unnamed protein product [Caenorhabditis bovis]|uniref:DnaJ homolog subfamily C member 1 n=1 Tax=Caenorhabditis bovis TaxID=2654633 RepID=A0A8S1ELR1_9PELO|nr:unnamed protein product [Caenorhabditis bovis]
MRTLHILLGIFLPLTNCQWTTEDLSLYDLVEDVNANFYEIFEVDREASTGQIKSAYRKLTLKWHPDRNSAPEATQKFQQIAGIYEILKSNELREKYNNILDNGLPSWRQPLYYYRRMRKLTWYEGILVLLFIATIAHYLMMWAAYFEKTLVYKQNMKKSRKSKKDTAVDADEAMHTALAEFRPKPRELLPILIVKGTISLCSDFVVVFKMMMKEKEADREEVVEAPKRQKPTAPPQPEFKFEMATNIKAVSTNDPEMEKKYKAESEVAAKKQAGCPWTPEELAHLVRLTTEKFPAGTPNRWEQMGRVLNRTEDDVITMAGKLKQMKQEDYTKLLMTSIQQNVPAEEPKEHEWTQAEQKQFELALQKYPKGTDERWDRIAEAIGTKSKKQVMLRFKQLAELVKKKNTTK